MKFYNDLYQRKVPQSVFPNKTIDLKPSLPIKSQYAFDDIFKRRPTEFSQLLSRAGHIDVQLERPKLLEVNLGQATLTKLLELDVPDPNDSMWLNEKNDIINRLKSTGSTDEQIKEYLKNNPPLGRKQNTIKSNSQSLASSNLSLSQKIDELQQEINEGRAQTAKQMTNIILNITQILNDIKNITYKNYQKLIILVNKLPDSLASPDFDIEYRFVDKKQFDSANGIITTLILKQAQLQNRDSEKTLGSLTKAGKETFISLKTFFGYMKTNDYIIDFNYRQTGLIAVLHIDQFKNLIQARVKSGEDLDNLDSECSFDLKDLLK